MAVELYGFNVTAAIVSVVLYILLAYISTQNFKEKGQELRWKKSQAAQQLVRDLQADEEAKHALWMVDAGLRYPSLSKKWFLSLIFDLSF